MDAKLWLMALVIAVIVTVREFIISILDSRSDTEFRDLLKKDKKK